MKKIVKIGDLVIVARLGVMEGRVTSIQGDWFVAQVASGVEAERNIDDEGITWCHTDNVATDALRVAQALR